MDLKLTLDEINLVMGALGNMPYAQVASLVNKISEQVKPQLQAQPAVPEVTE